jgi:Lrp/AsnC family transcriptional regulator, leucine-responsive regulatory protein
LGREAVESSDLDRSDREILRALGENGRMSYRELGEKVALSANATAERVRRLTETGVIAGFHAVVNPAAAGRTLVAMIDVRLTGPEGSVVETDTRIALRTVLRRLGASAP